SNIFVLSTYLLLSLVPFAALLFHQSITQPWRIITMTFVAWVTVWALFKRPACFHWLLLPAFLALPTELFLRMFYGQGISTHHLGILIETSPRDRAIASKIVSIQ
ncbi:MAG: hypothetical protein NWQ13_05440, partial [Glaciimonas sp.]|nr:hypothetical protein [Glaciimonas sp.]